MWSGGLQFSTLVKSSLVKTGGIRTGREGLHLMASAGASSGWNGTVLNGAAALWKVHAALTLVQIGYAGATVLQKATFNAGTNVIVFSVYRDIVSFSCLVPMAYLSERYVSQSDSDFPKGIGGQRRRSISLQTEAWRIRLGIASRVQTFFPETIRQLAEIGEGIKCSDRLLSKS